MIPNKDKQFYQFCAYGFLKNLRFFDPFILLFFLSKGFDYFDIGILYAIREIGFVLTEIPSGIFADAFGRKKSLIISYIAYLLSFLTFYFAQSFALIAVAMLIFSFGESFRSGTHKALIFAYLEHKNWIKHKTDYYGHTRACSQMGSAFSAAIAAGIVILNANLEIIFLFSTIPYLFGLINLTLYPNYLDKINSNDSFNVLIQNAFRLTLESWQAFKQKNLVLAALNLSIYSAYYKAVKDYFQVLILGFSMGIVFLPAFSSDQQNALFIGIAYTFLFLLSSVASKNSSKFNSLFSSDIKALNSSILLGIMAGALAGTFVFLNLNFIAILLFFGIYIIENLRKPIGISKIIDYSSERINATVLSVVSQVQAGITALLALFIGFVADLYSVDLALILSAVLLLLFAPVYWLKKQ
ncbi:MAG: MFS transporter [Bacteroidales bacterium]|nr:MFS transporter [Bacteroidales bacterium]